MSVTAKVFISLGVIFGLVLVTLAIYAAFVFTSVKRFAQYWSDHNQQTISKDSYIVVGLGDSTVQGIGATSPYKGFLGQVSKRVSQTTGKPVQVYNYSKSGAVASDVLANQLGQKNIIDQADVIVIAVGPNDLTKQVSKEDYFKSYQAILDALPKTKVVIASIPPLERSSVTLATVQDWNKSLAQMAAENKVRVAPVYDAIKPRSRDPLIYSIDLFHPSNIGYGLWAGAFYPPVLEVLNSTS